MIGTSGAAGDAGRTLPSGHFGPRAAPPETVPAAGGSAEPSASASGDCSPGLGGARIRERLASVGLTWDGVSDGGPRLVLGDLLGVGGTSRVFAARDVDLARDLAVKILAGDSARDGAQIAAFIDEASITASLSHPHVLPVHDFDVTVDGLPYFSMTRISGATLESAIGLSTPEARDPKVRSWNDVVGILIAVGRALTFAHHRGIVHQDIKPANILLGDFGEILLLDWGSAARWRDGGEARIYGTPLYMSPEQARRERATPASDVYCLGATLFHALTLRVPTWRDDPDEFWRLKQRGHVDPPTVPESRLVPPDLLAVALKALAPTPEARYASVDAMLRDLTAWQEGQRVEAYRDSLWRLLKRWYAFNRRLAWVTVVAASLVAALAVVLWHEKSLESADWQLIYRSDVADAAAIERDWTFLSTTWDSTAFSRERLSDGRHFSIRDGAVVARAGAEFVDMTFARTLRGDVRVDWDYRTSTGLNLNCYIGGEDRSHGYTFHFGGWGDPDSVVLTRGRLYEQLVSATRPGLLRPDTLLHYRMERDGAHVRLAINGETVIDYVEYDALLEPASVGFGFDCCWNQANEIRDIDVRHRPLPQRASPLAVGERLFQLGHFTQAAQAFAEIQDSYSGNDLEAPAEYRRARALVAAGESDAARALLDDFCTRFPRHEAAPMALVARRRLARLAGDAAAMKRIDDALRAFRGHPALLDVRRDWIAALKDAYRVAPDPAFYGAQIPAPEARERVIADYRALRDWCREHGVPEDLQTLDYIASGILFRLGHPEDVASTCSGDGQVAAGLMGMGRYDEARRRFPDDREIQASIALAEGDPERAFTIARLPSTRAGAAIDLVGPERFVASDPGNRLAQGKVFTATGHPDVVLATYADVRSECARSLNLLGRHAEVLDAYQDIFVQAVWERFDALVALGRCDEALDVLTGMTDEVTRLPAIWQVAIRRLQLGERARADELIARIEALPPTFGEDDAPELRMLMPAMLRVFDGERVDLADAWRDGALARREVLSQAPWHLAALVAGRIDEEGFLAQPCKRHLRQRLLLARALRAEVDARPADALAAYRRALSSQPITAFDKPTRMLMEWRVARLAVNP